MAMRPAFADIDLLLDALRKCRQSLAVRAADIKGREGPTCS
jgi:hypothetical protein